MSISLKERVGMSHPKQRSSNNDNKIKNRDKNKVGKKARLIMTSILLILYFIVLTFIVVTSGKNGGFSDLIPMIIFLSVSVILPLLGMNLSVR